MAHDESDNGITRKQFLIIIGVLFLVLGVGYYILDRGRIKTFEPGTVPAEGTVTLNGKPKANIRVTYHPQWDVGAVKYKPNGTTTADGKFRITTAKPFDGAPPGEYIVTFELIGVSDSTIDEEIDLFKGKYSDPAKSKWKIKVEANSNESFQLD